MLSFAGRGQSHLGSMDQRRGNQSRSATPSLAIPSCDRWVRIERHLSFRLSAARTDDGLRQVKNHDASTRDKRTLHSFSPFTLAQQHRSAGHSAKLRKTDGQSKHSPLPGGNSALFHASPGCMLNSLRPCTRRSQRVRQNSQTQE